MNVVIAKVIMLMMLINYNVNKSISVNEISFPVEIENHNNKIFITFNNKLNFEVYFNKYDSGYTGKLYNDILNAYCGSKKIDYIGPTTELIYLEENDIKLKVKDSVHFSFEWMPFYKIDECNENKLNLQYEYYYNNKKINKTIHFKSNIIEIPN